MHSRMCYFSLYDAEYISSRYLYLQIIKHANEQKLHKTLSISLHFQL